MGMGFAPTWLRQVSPSLLHVTTLTTEEWTVRVQVLSLSVTNTLIHPLTYSALYISTELIESQAAR